VIDLEYHPELSLPTAYFYVCPDTLPVGLDSVPEEQSNDLVLVKQVHKVPGGTTATFDSGKFNACNFT
jgi:hypothetical protein